jgi:hypothetical protein
VTTISRLNNQSALKEHVIKYGEEFATPTLRPGARSPILTRFGSRQSRDATTLQPRTREATSY